MANEKIINVKINGTIYKANAIKLKGNLKDEFKDGFCSNKTGTYYHLDDFLNLFHLCLS